MDTSDDPSKTRALLRQVGPWVAGAAVLVGVEVLVDVPEGAFVTLGVAMWLGFALHLSRRAVTSPTGA